MGEFRDGRPAAENGKALRELLEINCLGTVEIRATRPVGELVRAAVARHLESADFLLTDGEADAEVSGLVESFAVGFSRSGSAVTLDAVSLPSARAIQRRYTRNHTRWSKSRKPDYEVGPRVALLNLQRQFASDRDLAQFLGGGQRR